MAAVAAVGSCVFVAVYTPTSVGIIQARNGLQFDRFPIVTQTLARFGWYPLLLPIVLLALGVFAISRRKNVALIELLIGCLWLFALLWPAYCVFVCLCPEIPITSLSGPPSH
jgi:hypothetical protein